jgi:hypothetical protein
MSVWTRRLFAGSRASLLVACGGSDDDAPPALNIGQTAQADPRFSILVEAVVVTDGRNRKATITSTDIYTSNGVIHVIDKVLLPAL